MKNINKYRVDRSTRADVVPVGMASIQYIGNTLSQATHVFKNTPSGFDNWDQVNKTYGVVLSAWDESKAEYVVFDAKGFHNEKV